MKPLLMSATSVAALALVCFGVAARRPALAEERRTQAKEAASRAAEGQATPADARRLKVGVHLFVDDYLIARSDGVKRSVASPKRFLEEPIVTSKLEHQNWQPWLTVLHDPTAAPEKRFRMWYNADVVDDPADYAYASKLASGVWPFPVF